MQGKVAYGALTAVAEAGPQPVPAVVREPARKHPVKYQSSDGKPMADSLEQEMAMPYAGGRCGRTSARAGTSSWPWTCWCTTWNGIPRSA